jgi:hypothetical protein
MALFSTPRPTCADVRGGGGGGVYRTGGPAPYTPVMPSQDITTGWLSPYSARRRRQWTPEEAIRQEAFQQRFWARVDRNGDCWLWTGTNDGKGFGIVRVAGIQMTVHRVSYAIAQGMIPAGRYVKHRRGCPKSCVNPAHLSVVKG